MGVLRGFDQFMNLVLDGTVDTKTKADIGMVVGILNTLAPAISIIVCAPPASACCWHAKTHVSFFRLCRYVMRFSHVLWYHAQVVRGNSIVAIEALDGA